VPSEVFFASCPRGLEPVLENELIGLGAECVETKPGGVGFAGALTLAMRANLESRAASRVLWQVGQGTYATADDIYAGALALPWTQWFGPERTIRVDVTAIRSPLKSLEFATLRIKDAVCDKLRELSGLRPTVDTARPDVRIHAFLDPRRWTLHLDTSGEALFKRGWRAQGGEAPLRENLAAGILERLGWEPGMPLLDPMCGSGTFLVEAAHMALRRAPGVARSFGFQRLRPFDVKAFQRMRSQLQTRILPTRLLPILGSDRHARMVELARRNLEEAGVGGAVSLRTCDVLEVTPPGPVGLIVINPPYGLRLGDDAALQALYPKLGDLLKRRFAGWRAGIFSADTQLPRSIRLRAARRTPLFNGAIECRLYEYQMVEGSLRAKRAGVQA
jgi:putative N6-adenine-specific DNA methylase